MGVLDRLNGCEQVAGACVFMRGQRSRDFLYPPRNAPPQRALVVPRVVLDAAICESAVAAGAELCDKTLVTGVIEESGRVTGIEVTRKGQTAIIFAPAIIAADGAASGLAAKAGLAEGVSQRLGFALRGYYRGVEGLTGLLELYMPLTDPTDRYVLPSYGWVFPTEPDSANIGVGIFERAPGLTVRTIMERFLAELRERCSRFANIELDGALRGARLISSSGPSVAPSPDFCSLATPPAPSPVKASATHSNPARLPPKPSIAI